MWQPSDNGMMMRISTEMRDDITWYIAELFVDGKLAAEGECPNTGVYSVDDVAERTAIVAAQRRFNQLVYKVPITRVRDFK